MAEATAGVSQMINAQIRLQGFQYGVADGKDTKSGQEVKILIVKDAHSQFEVHMFFTPEQMEEFAGKMTGSKIIPAHSLANLVENEVNP
jgi:hypothetical protein